jgi:hypothetical protein
MANALEHLANQTKLEWTASLNVDFQPTKNYRRTSIIGTIGTQLAREALAVVISLTGPCLQDRRQTQPRRFLCSDLVL